MTKKTRKSMDRRSFVKLIPAAAGIAAVGVPALAAQAAKPQETRPATAPATAPSGAAPAAGQQRGGPQVPQRVGKEALHASEQVIGIEFTDAEEQMALRGVNQNLANYDTLRGLNVPLDTDPAFWFHPALPGKKFDMRPAAKFVARPQQAPAFKATEDLAFSTALQLGELIRTRKVSSTELTKMYLERLKQHSPKLLCVVTMTEDLALRQAEQADREIRVGKIRGPLHGVPYGIKDLFSAKGIRTTWGAEPFKDQVLDYDSTVVERLREAGAVLLAKLSTGALAMGGQWYGGMTKNPWNTERSSSGSSAGPASATAAGLVGFAVGTETLGSIVSPCSECGTTGLRPTYGRISRYGAMGLSWTMDKVGPICRSVEDCAAVLSVLYGPDGHDLTVSGVPFRWPPARPIAQMRIGYQKDEFEQGTNETRKAMYKEALEVLRSLGAKLEPVEMPKFPAGAIRFLLNAEAAAAFDDITRNKQINTLSAQGSSDWPNTFRTNRFVPAVEYIRAQRARTILMRQMDELMKNWDVFVSPAPGSSSLMLTNLTGHPACVQKCGFEVPQPGSGGRGGGGGRAAGEGAPPAAKAETPASPPVPLPRAIMFTAGLYDEAAALRLALAYEQATKWHTIHPKDFRV